MSTYHELSDIPDTLAFTTASGGGGWTRIRDGEYQFWEETDDGEIQPGTVWPARDVLRFTPFTDWPLGQRLINGAGA